MQIGLRLCKGEELDRLKRGQAKAKARTAQSDRKVNAR